MFEIYLYNYTKGKEIVNKLEYLGQSKILVGSLKEETSIVNPVITIQGNPIEYNYCYIPTFHRYYYITNITTKTNDLWEISLHVDVLTTYRNGIYFMPCCVERNESIYNILNVDVRRSFLKPYVEQFTRTSLFQKEAEWSYVITGFNVFVGGVLNSGSGVRLAENTCSTKMFNVAATDRQGMDNLANDIQNPNFFDTIFGSTPNDVTFNIHAYPLKLYKIVDESVHIRIGGAQTTAVNGVVISDSFLISTNLFLPSSSPLGEAFYDYNNQTVVELFLPYLGFVEMNNIDVINKFIHVGLCIDYITGVGTYTIYKTKNRIDDAPHIVLDETFFDNFDIVSQHIVNLGVEIPLTRSNSSDTKRNLLYSIGEASSSVLSGAVLGAIKGGKAGAIAGAIGGALYSSDNVSRSIIETDVKTMKTRRVGGSNFSGLTKTDVYYRVYRPTPLISEVGIEWENYLHQNGAPLVRYVSDLTDFIDTGYTELSSFHLDEPGFNRATEKELDELQSLLSQGIIL